MQLWHKIISANLILILACCHSIFSQNISSDSTLFVPIDEIYISKRDTIKTLRDTLIVTKNILIRSKDTLLALERKIFVGSVPLFAYKRDTIISIPDTIITSVDTVFSVNQIVLKRIENFSKKKNFISRLLRNVLVFDDQPVPIDTSGQEPVNTINTQDRYARYENKVIGKVEVQVLDVLGYSINNLNKKPRSLLENGGNSLHIKTHKNIIRNKLLFTTGDKVKTLQISESERLLRSTNYIYDARINIVEKPGTDTVDVYVLTQDVWSITGSGSYDLAGRATTVSARDFNFLGLGHQFENGFRVQNTLPSGYNYLGNYIINNIYRTQSSALLYYRYENGEKRYGGGVNREFLSPAIHLAGGVNYSRNELYTLNPIDSARHKLGYNQQDIWIGYSGKVNSKKENINNRMIVSGRLIRSDYFERPEYWSAAGFRSNNLYLASLGILDRSFFRDNYIFRLGRTEDIPEGRLLAVTAGKQTGEGLSRFYLGAVSTWAKFIPKFGYLYLSGGIGSYLASNTWQEGAYYGKLLYYTPLANWGNWRYRGFLSFRASHAINQPAGILTNVNRENGLRGLNSGLLFGTDKVVMNLENDFFPNFNLLGFRFGIIVFADLAWINNKNFLLDKGNFYQGYGLGLRIKNENLIFNMFQFFIGYYPEAKNLAKEPFQFFERTKYFYNYNDFEFSRPTPVPLN